VLIVLLPSTVTSWWYGRTLHVNQELGGTRPCSPLQSVPSDISQRGSTILDSGNHEIGATFHMVTSNAIHWDLNSVLKLLKPPKSP
jgi:hypothetical protein